MNEDGSQLRPSLEVWNDSNTLLRHKNPVVLLLKTLPTFTECFCMHYNAFSYLHNAVVPINTTEPVIIHVAPKHDKWKCLLCK